MKLKTQLRNAGFKSVKEFTAITDLKRATIYKWHKEKPKRFNIFVIGAASYKATYSRSEAKQIEFEEKANK